MTTPLSTLLTCPRDGGANTGVVIKATRLVCGATPTCDENHGFTSPAKVATGRYTCDFDGSYATAPFVCVSAEGNGDAYNAQLYTQPTTGQVEVIVYNDAGSAADPTAIHIIAVGV